MNGIDGTVDLKVLVIGSINADHWYQVESYTKPGCSSKALTHTRHIGGKGLNQARAIQRAGITNVRFLGIVGDDEDGKWLIQELNKKDFPTSEIMVVGGWKTGHVIIQQCGKEEELAVMFYIGANGSFTKTIIERAVKDADLVVLQNEMNEVQMVLDSCKEKRVLFNPSPTVPHLNANLFDVEWLIMNEPEFFKLLSILQIQTKSKDCNADLLKQVKCMTTAKNVIVTRGNEGSMAMSEEEEFIVVRAGDAEYVVDTIGAGDCYAGFMLRHLLHENGLKESMKFGTAATTLKIERNGAFDGIPSLEEVLERMAKEM